MQISLLILSFSSVSFSWVVGGVFNFSSMKEMVKQLESFCPELEERTDPSFFKIFLPQFSAQHLRIPPKFVKRLSKESFKRLILEDHNGKHWNVKLCKTADGIYIKDGWEDFAKEHSLWFYEFLVFRYDGDMCFKVMIFDKNGCERASTTTTTYQEPISHVVKMEPKEDGPAEEKFVSNSGKKKGRGRPPKKSAVTSTELSLWPTPSFARNWDSGTQASLERRKHLNEEQEELWKAVGSFTSGLPYLVRRLDPTNMTLYIPVDFSNEYLPGCSTQLTLRNQNGKAWIVNTIVNDRGYTYVRKGWKDFVYENHLSKGDICIFELVSEYEFHVHTFRLVEGRVCVP